MRRVTIRKFVDLEKKQLLYSLIASCPRSRTGKCHINVNDDTALPCLLVLHDNVNQLVSLINNK